MKPNDARAYLSQYRAWKEAENLLDDDVPNHVLTLRRRSEEIKRADLTDTAMHLLFEFLEEQAQAALNGLTIVRSH